MRASSLVAPLACLLLVSAAPPPGGGLAEEAQRLKAANAAAKAASLRSRALEAAAVNERDAARRAAKREAAVTARIGESEADIAAAGARVTLTEQLLGVQRDRLAARQQPILRLVAALQSFARRPAAAAVVQPGSIDDAVHVRATIGAILPVVRARTEALRQEIARTRKLQGDARLARRSLVEARGRLQAERLALVRMQGEHRLRSEQLGRTALFESDRAIAMGERARDILGRIETIEDADTVREALAALPGPLPRPAVGDRPDPVLPRFAVPPYRLPVDGRIVTGFGEVGDSGVRARGLTIGTWAGAAVVAPAGGRVVFARPFRGYGIVVIIDHGDGWSSAIAGLGAAAVGVGETVAQGQAIGRATDGDSPQVTVELRRRGRAVDLAALL